MKRRPVTHLPNRWPWDPKRRQHVVVAVRRGRPAVILCGKRRFKVDKISNYDASKADSPACIEVAAKL